MSKFNIELYKGWNSTDHLNNFNIWNNYSNSYFNFVFGSFFENKILINILKKKKFNSSIIDYGCSSGYLLRYINKQNKKFLKKNYLGVDISQFAINFAKKKYGEGYFKFIEKNNEKIDKKFDIVYSRDTVLHQTEPYLFLKKLINLSNSHIILRLRTKDTGDSIINPEISAQMHYDKFWMPYIVLNYDELIDYIKSFKEVHSIISNRSYEVLGGNNHRYLPKDLYFSSAGGSETSIIITKKNENMKDTSFILTEKFEEEGHVYFRNHKKKFLYYKVLNKLGI